jgi:hypothetical protein
MRERVPDRQHCRDGAFPCAGQSRGGQRLAPVDTRRVELLFGGARACDRLREREKQQGGGAFPCAGQSRGGQRLAPVDTRRVELLFERRYCSRELVGSERTNEQSYLARGSLREEGSTR